MEANIRMQPPPERLAMEEASTSALVREALDEAKELVRLEVELAKKEMTVELEQAKKAAIAFAVTAVFGAIALCLGCVGLVLALGGTAIIAIVLAASSLGIAVIGGGVVYALIPTRPFQHTRERLETDFNQLKEHLA